MASLWRLTLWGSTAATALLVAILASRSEVGSQRAGVALSSMNASRPAQGTTLAASREPPASSFNAESATQQLAQTVRHLAEDRDRIKTRLAAVEHNLDDITGSITRQTEAAKAPTPPPWPDSDTPAPPTSATVAEAAAAMVPPFASAFPPSSPPAEAPAPPAPSPAAEAAAYGVDIGGGLTLNGLRARWAGIRSAHPDLFEGLQPRVVVRKAVRSGRAEMRLIVGPLAGLEAAAVLCASIASYKLACRPALFEGQHLAKR